MATASSGRINSAQPAERPDARNQPRWFARVAFTWQSVDKAVNSNSAVCDMKLPPMNSKNGDTAQSAITHLARSVSYISRINSYMTRMHRPVNTGLTRAGAPTFIPTARSSGQPGGNTLNQRPSWSIIQDEGKNSGDAGAGANR